jgi:thiol-disulfide isomerase/thioredoxin
VRLRPLATLVCAAALVLTAAGCTSLQGTGDKQYVSGDGAINQVAVTDRGDPVDYDGKDLDGTHLSLASLRGKPTVVSVWWANCPPCRKEAPLLVGAAEQLGESAHFVGVDVRDSGTAGPKTFQDQFGVTWPSFYSPGGEALLAFPGTLTPNSIPATVVLDDQGRVAASIIGAVPSQLTLVQMVRQVARGG